MNNAEKFLLLKKTAIFAIAGTMLVGQVAAIGMSASKKAYASAPNPAQEIVYCDDTVYGDDEDIPFQGEGVHIDADYTIECDEMVTLASAGIRSMPSYGNTDTSMQNVCGPMAGTNIVVFYDRFHTELISNYNPGMVVSTGIYRYFPDLGTTETRNVISSLYSSMGVAAFGGTTATNFRNGLRSYVIGQGKSISYSSVYQNAATINLSTFGTAMNQDKVGVIMCSQYNFVYSKQMGADGTYASVGKIHSTAAHIMMVFGYETIGFYQDGELVCTKTFLNACSGFGSREIGWLELNDSAVINEAWVVSIT